MQFGISSYSLIRALRSGEMDLAGLMTWVAEQGAEHIEIVPMGPLAVPDIAAARSIAALAADHGLAISSYTIGATFIHDERAAWVAEVERLKVEVDKAQAMGVTRMRHDAGWRPADGNDDATFEADLPHMVDGARAVALHAAEAGITTSVENHGFHVQRHDRVLRLVREVGLDNYRITIDVGNFLCADDDPLTAVSACLPLISMLHVKDFYIREPGPQFADGWIQTPGGKRLRGAVIGWGDIDMLAVLAAVAASGYDGPCSVEFEGGEDCRTGTATGLANLKALWAGAQAAAELSA